MEKKTWTLGEKERASSRCRPLIMDGEDYFYRRPTLVTLLLFSLSLSHSLSEFIIIIHKVIMRFSLLYTIV